MISHDLGLAASYAEDIIVMYAGQVVERAPAGELFGDVRMPYTQALLDAMPRIELEPHVLLPVVGGRPPDLSAIPLGCPFAPRCPGVQQDCREQPPRLAEHEPGRWWACWHPCGRGAPR
jgi:oligopeptide/dipeptide ABC transporter ATP-binding protein